jgi:acetyl esterase/lipase
MLQEFKLTAFCSQGQIEPKMTLLSSPKSYLSVRFLRLITALNAHMERSRVKPPLPHPAFQKAIPSRSSTNPGDIPLLFYTPASYNRDAPVNELHPLVINFHGGGFCIGDARDDERWAAKLTSLGAVVVSVEYRLGPEHRYPTALTDGVDAVLWLWEHAAKYGLDKKRTVLTGFSAGGLLAMTIPMMLSADFGFGKPGGPDGALGGIVMFYPPMDWSRSREERMASNAISKEKGMPEWVNNAFDWAYLGTNKPDMKSMYLAPGLAPAEVLKEYLPDKIAFYICGWDALLDEEEMAIKRLKELGKNVTRELTEEEPHYWDHMARSPESIKKRDEIYEKAGTEVMSMWNGRP